MTNIFTINEVCESLEDGNWIESKDQSKDGIRLIQTGNIKNGYFEENLHKARYVSEKTFNKLNCKEVFEGDILISRLPDPVGRGCILPKLENRSITAVDCAIVRVKKNLIQNKYFLYFLQSPQYRFQVNQNVTGTTRSRISRKNLGEINIPVPSLQEQVKIVGRLDKVFNYISTQIENIETQINLNSLIFESYFEKVQSNFNNSGTISEFFDLATGGTPSKKNKDYFNNGNIPWLLSGDIHQENILESKNFITEDALKNSNAKYLPIGSVLIALNGQGKTRGTVALLKINATCNQSLVSINSKDNNVIENEFLFYYLKSQYKKIRKLTGDSGNDRRGLNMKIINNMLIKFPEISVQKKIVDNCKSLSEINKNLTKILDSKMNKYVGLKNSLLNREFAYE